jgi:pentatricopeptide repeat protein
LEDAVKVFEEMQQRGVKPDIGTWNALINWHCKGGDLKGAVRFLFLGNTRARPVPGSENISQYNYPFRGARKVGHDMEIIRLYVNKGNRQSGVIYAILADIYGQYGQFRNAECVAAIRSEGVMLSASVFCALANAFVQHGLCEHTVKVLELMEAEGFEINLIW